MSRLAVSLAERFGASFAAGTYIDEMTLDLTDVETPALIALLKQAIADDRYPLSERVQIWQGILDKLEPRPAHEPARSPPKIYASPTKDRWRPRRGCQSPNGVSDLSAHNAAAARSTWW